MIAIVPIVIVVVSIIALHMLAASDSRCAMLAVLQLRT